MNVDIKGSSIDVKRADLTLTGETDESYTLIVEKPTVQITAETVFGAMHALETFSQLIYKGTFVNATTVHDYPRFQYRASMIDTSRHWYPLAVILEHIDVMAFNKFNVLHWHIVDSVSFPFQSTTYPSLSATGAFTPTHIYSHADVSRVVQYAMSRGIRVLPEFDTPGHVGAGVASIPDLLTPCYSNGSPDGSFGPLNPMLNSTYDYLTRLYAEVKGLFPDKFVHVGGDEVSFACWESNPAIQRWVAEKGYSSYSQVEQYYELRLLDILAAQNTSYMCWEEVFDNGVHILPDTVVNVWKGGWQQTMARATAAGYKTVLSAPFYLNYISYGRDWVKYYQVEPTNFTCAAGASSQTCDKALVGGIEMCMWSEFVDSTNFISRTWPRGSAVGERAWSAQSVRDVNDAQIRLHEWRCKLLARGIAAEPIADGGSPPPGGAYCENELIPSYTPKWNNN